MTCLIAPAATSVAEAAESSRPHVLHVVVDDLRTSVGAYGDPIAQTPVMDQLARDGTMFEHAYVQQAVCSASRASVLTGLRPTATTVDYPYNPAFRNQISQDNPTFPTWFEEAGAWTRMIGKVHHDSPKRIETIDAPPSSRVTKEATYMDYAVPEHADLARAHFKDPKGTAGTLPAFESEDVADDGYVDGRNADAAIKAIRQYAREQAAGETTDPMFISLGFLKPHLPFNAPQKYWDLYDPASLPSFVTPPPQDAPRWVTATYELASKYDTREQARNLPLPDDTARTLTHGYYACVSYIDAQLGRVLDALEEEGLADQTLVVLWSDHGFHLGDNGMWGKHVNYEVATRVPLMFRGPGVEAGVRVEPPVELIDLYPTICELGGVKPPAHLEGKSLVPLMQNPNAAEPDAVAVSEFPRGPRHGWSLRTATHRYVEWRKNDGSIVFRELYDHRSDPKELTNLAADEPALLEELAARLHEADPASAGAAGS